MTKLNPSMRLKVKGDTFFIPDSNGGVYFRNNSGSFRMEGTGVDQWVSKLLPVLDGRHSLEELTDGLPDEYRNRVVEIAEKLYTNGFVRVMEDLPHQLPDPILQKYASQIEFLNSFGGSGAYRFQTCRQANVLAVGSGPWLVSLASALLESGLPRFQVLITDTVPTNRQRLAELAAHACKTDPEVTVEELSLPKEGVSSWREIVGLFDSVLYVSQEGDLKELRALHAACREEKKRFLPAVGLQQMGLAGPLVHPDSNACWESAWRRIHQSALDKARSLPSVSSTAGAMLANVIVFEWFKKAAGLGESDQSNKVFLLDQDTLEGCWHSFIPHPLVAGHAGVRSINAHELRLDESPEGGDSNELLTYFSLLTSAESGIFHLWEEGDLKQLPLAQCRVQAVDPLSEGPAGLLPDQICTGLTHVEARREAGLAGMEAYVSSMADVLVPHEWIGIGAGETVAEGVCRGLHRCLTEELGKRQGKQKQPPSVRRVMLNAVEDERCRFYLQALTTMQGVPLIGWGEEVSGFPVAWVGTNGRWYGSAGLNMTLALRQALQQALLKAQNPKACFTTQPLEAPSVHWTDAQTQSLDIPACEGRMQRETLESALQILARNRRRPVIFDLAVEPFMKEKLAGVFGVALREEESR